MEEQKQEILPKLRVCKQCNTIYNLLTHFSRNRNINEKETTYRHRCITCEKTLKIQKNKANYEKNKEKLKQQYIENKRLKQINNSDYII